MVIVIFQNQFCGTSNTYANNNLKMQKTHVSIQIQDNLEKPCSRVLFLSKLLQVLQEYGVGHLCLTKMDCLLRLSENCATLQRDLL